MVYGVILWLSGNRRCYDCNIYVSLIATSADRVPKVRIPIHLRCTDINESLRLINVLTRRCCVAQD
jgi:hypothetical protein